MCKNYEAFHASFRPKNKGLGPYIWGHEDFGNEYPGLVRRKNSKLAKINDKN